MVSVNNNISSVNHLNISQAQVKPKETTFSGLLGQKPSTKTDKKFSQVLDAQTNVSTKKVEQSKPNISTYSPLMLRYGANRIDEIKNIAKEHGVDDLTNEDFDYAIRYGRSLLADYLV